MVEQHVIQSPVGSIASFKSTQRTLVQKQQVFESLDNFHYNYNYTLQIPHATGVTGTWIGMSFNVLLSAQTQHLKIPASSNCIKSLPILIRWHLRAWPYRDQRTVINEKSWSWWLGKTLHFYILHCSKKQFSLKMVIDSLICRTRHVSRQSLLYCGWWHKAEHRAWCQWITVFFELWDSHQV